MSAVFCLLISFFRPSLYMVRPMAATASSTSTKKTMNSLSAPVGPGDGSKGIVSVDMVLMTLALGLRGKPNVVQGNRAQEPLGSMAALQRLSQPLSMLRRSRLVGRPCSMLCAGSGCRRRCSAS